MLGRGHRICIIFYSINTAHQLLLCSGIMMMLTYWIVDFHLFYDGAFDIQVTVKACGPLVILNQCTCTGTCM